jgi:LUD domain
MTEEMPRQFDEVRRSYYENRCETAVKALDKRWFDARWFSTTERAVEAVLETIPPGSRIGAGGSVTLWESGLMDALADRGDDLVYHRPDMEFDRSMGVRREAIACPYFLCSSNAVTMEGELVNMDGMGNRVAGMIFGPQTVIVVAGVNKLVADRDAAFTRIREVAAPANATRLRMDLPCVKKGRCVDCREPANICRVTSVISLKPILTDVKVFLVAEPLGL